MPLHFEATLLGKLQAMSTLLGCILLTVSDFLSTSSHSSLKWDVKYLDKGKHSMCRLHAVQEKKNIVFIY